MTTATDGEICYGVLFPDEWKMPWNDDDKYDGDINEWWIDHSGFVPSFAPFDDRGYYVPGVTPEDPRIDTWLGERAQWLEAHPLPPIELVNVCSGEVPRWIVAAERPRYTAHRGYPVVIDVVDLYSTLDQQTAIKLFIATHILAYCNASQIQYLESDPDYAKGPQWYLGSCWK